MMYLYFYDTESQWPAMGGGAWGGRPPHGRRSLRIFRRMLPYTCRPRASPHHRAHLRAYLRAHVAPAMQMRGRARLIDGEKSQGCPVALDGRMQGENGRMSLPRERPLLCRDAFMIILSYRISIIRRFPPGTCRRAVGCAVPRSSDRGAGTGGGAVFFPPVRMVWWCRWPQN